MLFFIIILGITLLYFIIIISFIFGWKNINLYKKGQIGPSFPFISLVIAARNEEKNISNLINTLAQQSIGATGFEIILVDDHSTDNTLQIAQSFESIVKNLTIHSLKKNTGKKHAISLGITHSNGNLIVTTDADCIPHKNWLETIAGFYTHHQPKLIIGPVLMRGNSFFKKIQALDFFALMTSGGAATGIKKPIMCNGANLAFEKEIYLELTDPQYSKEVSGDDVFLMLSLKKNYQDKILFLKSEQATVITEPENSFINFIAQRKRWASKSKSYKDFDILFVSVTVLLMNLSLLTNLILIIFSSCFLWIFLLQLLLKSMVDFIFLYDTSFDFKQQKLLKYFLPAQIFNVVMIPYLAIAGITGSITWKGRKTK